MPGISQLLGEPPKQLALARHLETGTDLKRPSEPRSQPHIVEGLAERRKQQYLSRPQMLEAKTYDLSVTFQLRSSPGGKTPPDRTQIPRMPDFSFWYVETGKTDWARIATIPTFPAGSDPESFCLNCDRQAFPLFTRCKQADFNGGCYCSDYCRDLDPIHNHVCGQLGKLGDRPGRMHYRAWMFPTDSDKSEAVWLHAEFAPDTGQICFKFDQPSVVAWSRTQDRINGWISPYITTLTAVHQMQIKGRDALIMGLDPGPQCSAMPSQVNRSIMALGRKPGYVQPQFGPVFVLGYARSTREINAKTPLTELTQQVKGDYRSHFCNFVDTNLRDLKRAVDAIRNCTNYPVMSPMRPLKGAYTAFGVKVNNVRCPWNKSLGITGELERVITSATEASMPIAKAFQMGLRWMILPIPVPRSHKPEHLVPWSKKNDGAFLSLFEHVLDVNHKTASDATEFSAHRLVVWNSFVIHHANGLGIDPLHVKGVCAYVRYAESDGLMLNGDDLQVYWDRLFNFWNAKLKISSKGERSFTIGSPRDLEQQMETGNAPIQPIPWVERALDFMVPPSVESSNSSPSS